MCARNSPEASSRVSGCEAMSQNVVVYRDMNKAIHSPQHLSDSDLIAEVSRLTEFERQAVAKLVLALSEMDSRRLYLGQGYSSMFTYCTQVLHLAEHAAFNRIEAARVGRRFPIIFELLADGRIHLSAVRLLAPHLTDANHNALLAEASQKSKREIEQIVARLAPRPDVRASVRKLPSTAAPPKTIQPAMSESAPIEVAEAAIPTPAQRPKAEPLAPGRYKMQFTVAEETYQKFRRVQDLLRHRLSNGDPATIFDRALTLLLSDLQRKKTAATDQPRRSPSSNARSRHVPAEVRRAVWKRDGGRCRFEGASGRCAETGLLEFHHIIPYADGGSTTRDNIELRCAAHNRYEAEQWFRLFVRESPSPYASWARSIDRWGLIRFGGRVS
jgi:HNH endonuclease